MTDYTARQGRRTDATIWRAVADSPHTLVNPDGVMDLLWFQDELVVAGPDTASSIVATAAGEATWGLQLPPGVAHALLGVPATELTDRRTPLAELAAIPAIRRAQLARAPAAGLEAVYAALWARADPDRGLLRVAASLDRAARAGGNVTATAAAHGLSPRSLQRLSNRLFGYGPKTLARIHRLRRGLQFLAGGEPAGVAAALAGYADQSHFNRDARALTGRTPLELRGVDDAVRIVQSRPDAQVAG